MRVALWNVWYRAPFAAILRTLQALDADVLMLQELTSESKFNPGVDMPDIIKRELQMDAASIPVRVIRNRRGVVLHQEHLGIFTRQAITHACHPVLRSGGTLKGARAESYRRYLQVQVGSDDGFPWKFGLTHLSYPLLGLWEDERRAEVATLEKFIREPTGRFIFGGDFNATVSSRAVTMARKHLVDLGPAHFYSSFTLWPGHRTPIDRRLDWAFGTADVARRSQARLGTDLNHPSNHHPLIIDISAI